MNRFLKVFFVMFVSFLVILILNVVNQMGTPLSGDWGTIASNFLNFFPYIALIALGIFYVLERGK